MQISIFSIHKTQNLPNLFQPRMVSAVGGENKETRKPRVRQKTKECAILINRKQKPWLSELYIVCK